LKLAQYQALRDYLSSRARQFALLATRINELVRELEAARRASAPAWVPNSRAWP